LVPTVTVAVALVPPSMTVTVLSIALAGHID
jgi:hypothetical protein